MSLTQPSDERRGTDRIAAHQANCSLGCGSPGLHSRVAQVAGGKRQCYAERIAKMRESGGYRPVDLSGVDCVSVRLGLSSALCPPAESASASRWA